MTKEKFEHRLNAKRKAQVFSWDLVIACIIFAVVMSMALYYWLSVKSEILTAEEVYTLQKTVNDVGEHLMRTTGAPSDWSKENVVTIGLAETRFFFGGGSLYGRIVDPVKLLNTIYLVDRYYHNDSKPIGESKTTIRDMFTQGAYDFYINISCVNPSANATLNLSECFGGAVAKTHSLASPSVNCTEGARFNIALKKEFETTVGTPYSSNQSITFTPKRTMAVGRVWLPEAGTNTILTINTCCKGEIAHTLPFSWEYTSSFGIPLNASVILLRDTPYNFTVYGNHKGSGSLFSDGNATMDGGTIAITLYSAEGEITVSNATFCLIGERENITSENVTIVVSTTKTCGISTLKIADFSVVPLKESDSSLVVKMAIWKHR